MQVTSQAHNPDDDWYSRIENRMYKATPKELSCWLTDQQKDEGDPIKPDIQPWFADRAEDKGPGEAEIDKCIQIATATHFARVAMELDGVHPTPKPASFTTAVQKYREYNPQTSDTLPYELAIEIFQAGFHPTQENIAVGFRARTWKILDIARSIKPYCHCQDTSSWGLAKDLLDRYESAFREIQAIVDVEE